MFHKTNSSTLLLASFFGSTYLAISCTGSCFMKHTTFLLWLLALAFGITISLLDMHATEVQGTVLLILVASGLLGFVLPGRAWLWAITIALCLPLVYLSASLFGYPSHNVEPNVFATVIALIPAFLGAYGGVLLRYMIAPPRHA